MSKGNKANSRSSSSSSSIRNLSMSQPRTKKKSSKKKNSNSNRIPLQRPPSSQSSSRGRTAAAGNRKSKDQLPSANVVRNAINASVRRQNKTNDRLEESVELYPALEGDCDDGDSASPIMDLFVNESGPGVIKAMTPLTRLEFDRVWDIVSVPFVYR